MQDFNRAKAILESSHNIAVLPSPQYQADTFPAALGLCYSLKKLGKNVNLLSKNHPARFNFLVDNRILNNSNNQGQGADFLITIKERKKDGFSELSYEKTKQGLDLFLKTNQGDLDQQDITIKKITSNKPNGIGRKTMAEDVLITIGVSALEQAEKYLQDPESPIINIDLNPHNKKYGEANLIDDQSASFSEIIFDLLRYLQDKPFEEQSANSLLAGIVFGSKNLQSPKITSGSFEKINCLTEQGANLTASRQALYGVLEKNSLAIFAKILNKLRIDPEKNLATATISVDEFKETNSSPSNLSFALRKLSSGLFPFENLLLLWEQNSSPLYVRGVFYSEQKSFLDKLSSQFESEQKGDALLFKTKEKDLKEAQEKIMAILN